MRPSSHVLHRHERQLDALAGRELPHLDVLGHHDAAVGDGRDRVVRDRRQRLEAEADAGLDVRRPARRGAGTDGHVVVDRVVAEALARAAAQSRSYERVPDLGDDGRHVAIAHRAPRSSTPGRAPVSSPRSNVTSPALIVAT